MCFPHILSSISSGSNYHLVWRAPQTILFQANGKRDRTSSSFPSACSDGSFSSRLKLWSFCNTFHGFSTGPFWCAQS